MSQPADMIDALSLNFEPALERLDRPMSMRRAIVLWVGLSLGGWGIIIAALGFAVL